MSLSLPDQILHALKRAERPVIVLKELASIDDFASAFGLAAVMKKLGKDAEIVCASGRAPESLAFLKTVKPVKGDVPNLRSLTIHVDVSKASVDELSYSVVHGELRVHIMPKNGFWNREDVKIATTAFRYDLVILIGCQDLKSLGALQEKYADFFYETPIMNLDHNPSNEHFGQYNVVDIGATSVGEVLFELTEKIDAALIDEDIATSFLAGMIAKTKSFRTQNVTPKTLATASALIAKGAKREEIVELAQLKPCVCGAGHCLASSQITLRDWFGPRSPVRILRALLLKKMHSRILFPNFFLPLQMLGWWLFSMNMPMVT
jgi:nanoRNase/pAp phosphatase (c-di-AMP/oligoRNAs hydrolase)